MTLQELFVLYSNRLKIDSKTLPVYNAQTVSYSHETPLFVAAWLAATVRQWEGGKPQLADDEEGGINIESTSVKFGERGGCEVSVECN